MSGKVLGGRYRIMRELGKADNRRTLLAEDLQTRSQVVIKLLLFRGSPDPDAIRLFKRETETLASLSHPAIPRYLNFFELGSATGSTGLALVQTYIQGRSLASYLQIGRRFSEQETKYIGAAVLEILVYLHQLSPPVIHRDIKPDNILLSGGSSTLDQIYLVDFGAVKTISSTENTNLTIVGTQGYMPPEQFSGRVTPASDLYSLGTTLVTVATGTPIAKIPRRNLRLRFEDLVPLTPEFTTWLKWLIELEASNRPTSAQAALDRLLNPQEPTSTTGQFQPIANIPRKPPESRITLVKTGTFLEIRLPAVGITTMTVWILLWELLIGTIVGWWLVNVVRALFRTGLTGLNGLTLPLMACLVTVLLIGALVGSVFALWGQTRLRLDDRISLSHGMFGFQFIYPPPDNIRKVIRLASVQTKSLPHILLQAGAAQYYLGRNPVLAIAQRLGLPTQALGALTLEETNWLVQELSQWLKLSVSHRW